MNKRPSGDAAKHRARCRLRIKRPLQLGFGFALSLVGCQNPPLFACFRQHDRVAFGSLCRATATEAPGPRSFALRKPAALARQQSREGVSSFALKNQFFVARPSKRQAARSLRRYLRARSRAACLPHALTRHKSSSPGVAGIDRPKTEWHKLPASKATEPGRHHLGKPGDIMSERWARSSRNAWATSSESAGIRTRVPLPPLAKTANGAIHRPDPERQAFSNRQSSLSMEVGQCRQTQSSGLSRL
jgi:hypothetical protein